MGVSAEAGAQTSSEPKAAPTMVPTSAQNCVKMRVERLAGKCAYVFTEMVLDTQIS